MSTRCVPYIYWACWHSVLILALASVLINRHIRSHCTYYTLLQVLAEPADVEPEPAVDMEAARGIIPEEDEQELTTHEQQRLRRVEAANKSQQEWQEELGPLRGRSDRGSRSGGLPPAAVVAGPLPESAGACVAPAGPPLCSGSGLIAQGGEGPGSSGDPPPVANSANVPGAHVEPDAKRAKRWHPQDIAAYVKQTEASARASLPPQSGFLIDMPNGRFKCVSGGHQPQRFKSFSWTIRSVPAAFAEIYKTAWENHAAKTGEAAPRDAEEVAAELYGALAGNIP